MSHLPQVMELYGQLVPHFKRVDLYHTSLGYQYSLTTKGLPPSSLEYVFSSEEVLEPDFISNALKRMLPNGKEVRPSRRSKPKNKNKSGDGSGESKSV